MGGIGWIDRLNGGIDLGICGNLTGMTVEERRDLPMSENFRIFCFAFSLSHRHFVLCVGDSANDDLFRDGQTTSFLLTEKEETLYFNKIKFSSKIQFFCSLN